jgi:hypothetical protein
MLYNFLMMKNLPMNAAAVIMGISRSAIYKRIGTGAVPETASPEELVRMEINNLRQAADTMEKRLAAFLDDEPQQNQKEEVMA